MAWIDYRKVFDSLPHAWIMEGLEIYKVCPTIRTFLKDSMTRWKSQMCLCCDKGVLMTRSIAIRRSIFQGDSLSAFLFCRSLFPLTQLLNEQQFGYVVGGENVTHLLCMDDLKLFTKDEDQMKQALVIVENFGTDIQMSFGLDKCATVVTGNGKVVHSTLTAIPTWKVLMQKRRTDTLGQRRLWE